MGFILICGLLGAALDILLHVFQLIRLAWLPKVTMRVAAWVTLASCVLVGITLTTHFNLAAALIEGFIGLLSLYAIVANKEIDV